MLPPKSKHDFFFVIIIIIIIYLGVFFVVIFKEKEGIREVDKEENTRAIFLANHLSNDTHHGSRISLSCLQLRIACPIKDPLHTAKQRACSVNTDINRLIFACVKSLSEQLKNHIPKEINRQAEKTGEKNHLNYNLRYHIKRHKTSTMNSKAATSRLIEK